MFQAAPISNANGRYLAGISLKPSSGTGTKRVATDANLPEPHWAPP